ARRRVGALVRDQQRHGGTDGPAEHAREHRRCKGAAHPEHPSDEGTGEQRPQEERREEPQVATQAVEHGGAGDGHDPAPRYPSSSTVSAPSAKRARNTFLSNLPTLVLGTSSMKLQRSGSCQRATRWARNARSCSASADDPAARTTHASGRSSQRGSGTPITAASTT